VCWLAFAAGDSGRSAVCEDLSKGGLSFRSRNQYPEGTRAEVAVPFTPGAGAIFVPIRIVFRKRCQPWTLPARRRVCETADGWGLAEREDFLSRADREYQLEAGVAILTCHQTWITGPAKTT